MPSFPPLLARALGTMALSLSLVAAPSTPLAGPVPWTEAAYSYYADNAPIAQVLRDFAASFSLSLELSPLVEGQVNGRFNAQSPSEFMGRLASVYGLTWFTHAGTLYVARTTEMSTRSISAGGASISTVRQALTSLGVLEPRFGWGELPEQGMALVSGPPAYVALVERTMAVLPLTGGGQQVAVFRLKHASVDDRVIQYRDRQITTPGLAQVLRNLIQGSSAPIGMAGGAGGVGAALAPIGVQQASLRGPVAEPGLPARANVGGVVFDPANPGRAGAGSLAAGQYLPAQPGGAGAAAAGMAPAATLVSRPVASIQADSRLNALIVQDTPERIPLYKTLIEQLDVPTPLIEIEAMIIDINSTKLDELGISWSGRRGGAAGGFGNLAAKGDGNDFFLGALQRTASIDPSTLVVNTGNFLVSRIRALEGTGDASIQSRPSILTIDNIGALLDLSETFYIRSVGERVATVTPITAGTTLRVTPHYVQRPEGPVIQLDVDIEDGQIQETTVDTIPTVRRSTVSTQAIVAEGQTLLIGGYKSTQQLNRNDRVPVVGELPLLGLLFSNRTSSQQVRERLFMIQPRVVSLLPQTAAALDALRPARLPEPGQALQ
ncbi:SctC family type III secretion system outer membrane ring subunit BscC [Melaminivora sp.]